jgi:flagellar basal body rod protein FlgG
MKKIILLLLFSQRLFSQEFSDELLPFDEYMILINDLANSSTNGYKSHMLDINLEKRILERRATKNINFSQGSLLLTNRDLDFAIIGDGFFKIILSDGSIAYTRNGEFMIDEKTKELKIINGGYKLFDTIKIEHDYSQLVFNNDNSIITIYPNGKEINNGILKIYNLDTNKLVSTNGVIFFYNGDEENIANSKIYKGFIEESNVFKIDTQVRLIIICKKLGMNWENKIE